MITYTKVGESYSKDDIDNAILRTSWETFRISDLPFMQGEAIKAVVSQCNIPLKGIKRMDLHNVISKDGEQHGFFALDVIYANGRAQIYIADSGYEVVIVASNFEPFKN